MPCRGSSAGDTRRKEGSTSERLPFGAVLGRFRAAVGLTQEELAERANLSVEAIGALERGVRTRPRPSTLRLLADALKLSPDDRAVLEHAARAEDTTAHAEDALPEGEFLGALPRGELVARHEERERFHALLTSIMEGDGQALMLAGETGIGKTRLLQELMVEARGRGHIVLTGRCSRDEHLGRYQPMLDALSGLPARAPPGTRTEVQRGWKRIQKLAEEATGGEVAENGALAQQRVFTAISDLLLLVARSAPVSLLLDDLQYADVDSLKLLAHLARTTRTAPLLLAAAFRDLQLTEEHPNLARTLQALSRERLAERLVVRRLSLEETTQLVATTMGSEEASEEFASFVYRRTKGIPRLIDQLVRSLGGRLQLQGEIGAGAMGRVFRAFDRTTRQTVAAKLVLARAEIDLDALLRFQQEGAVLSKLDHPHIVHIYETFAEEHASCIIMELLEGRSLGQILQGGPLPLPRAKELALQVADALSYAHGQDIVHRDIKPDNVMVLGGHPGDTRVKVTDFGIARILQPDTSLQTIATTGMRMGTPLYMAPEQIEGKKIDGRTDIYALGAMLYHMVTGRPPFEGNDALSVAVKHLQEEPLPPSQVKAGLPSAWDNLILKALAKEPKERFQSANEMAKAMQALQVTSAVDPTTHPALGGLRLRLAGALAAIAAVVAVVLGMTVFRPGSTTAHTQLVLARKLDTYLTALTHHGQMSGTVLVARGGHIILSKGYGVADRQPPVPNRPMVKYPSMATFNIALTAALKLEEAGTLRFADRICRYLTTCPSNWKPITIGEVVDGTSGLTWIDWSSLPGTPAQSLTACQTVNLEGVFPGTTDYQNCAVVVLGTIFEKVTGQPWKTVIRSTVLDPAGMRDTGRLTDALAPPARANDYDGAASGAHYYYNPYFELYSTTPDTLRYDDALFGGTLLSPADLKTALTPRNGAADPDIPDARMAYRWKVGHLAGQSVIYSYDTPDQIFTGINMRFPRDGTTVIVNSNVKQDDAEQIGVNLARLIYGRPVAVPGLVPRRLAISPSRAIERIINLQIDGADLPAFADHTIWQPNDNTGTLIRVDTRTNQVAGITKVGVPGSQGDPLTVAASGSQIWIIRNVAQEVDRVDPATGNVVARVPVGVPLGDLNIAHGSVWAAGFATLRIDSRTHKVTTIGHQLGGTELAAGGDTVWVSGSGLGVVRRIDAHTNRVTAVIHLGTDPESIALGYGSVWVVNGTGGHLSRIDPRTNQVIAQIPLGTEELLKSIGPCCHGIAIGFGAVWVAVHKDHKVVRVDPATNRVTSQFVLPIPGAVTKIDVWDVMVGDGSVWVHAEPHFLFRINPKAMATG